jgi:3-deoxy-manno-octulosonate cytidylyltransferase (CMP-KDO synthetase)
MHGNEINTGSSGTVLVIPARYASSRFPGKPLAMINGIPMIVRVLNRAKQVKHVSRVIVATDHNGIRSVVETAGGQVVMTPPDLPSGTDRVAAAVSGMDCEYVVNLQGDEPLINPDHINRALKDLQSDPPADMATLASPMHSRTDVMNPNIVKVLINALGHAVYFSRAPVPCPAGPSPPDWNLYRRHIGLYIYRKHFLDRFVASGPAWSEKVEKLEQLRVLHHGGIIHVSLVDGVDPGVDIPGDIGIIERLLRERHEP